MLALATAFLTPPLALHDHHSHAAPTVERPASTISLLFAPETEGPDQASALESIDGATLVDEVDDATWTFDTAAGRLSLARVDVFQGYMFAPIDSKRFTDAQREVLQGEHVVLTLQSHLGEGGLPRFHQQIKDLVASAASLGLEEPRALQDLSGDRFHPPGWIERMAASEAGPAPGATYVRHSVYDETDDGQRRAWIHTHGIARFTGYELSCLEVRSEHSEALWEVASLAAGFAVDTMDWDEGVPTPMMYGLELARVPWKDGVKALSPTLTGQAKDHDDAHDLAHVLVVEGDNGWTCPGPAAAALEFFMVAQSQRETDRGATAARETYDAMRDWTRSTARPHGILIKAPLDVDGGADREHVWFGVTSLRRKSIKAELLSKPHGEADLAPGDTTTLEIDEISGWSVQTDEGNYGPDELEALFVLDAEKSQR